MGGDGAGLLPPAPGDDALAAERRGLTSGSPNITNTTAEKGKYVVVVVVVVVVYAATYHHHH